MPSTFHPCNPRRSARVRLTLAFTLLVLVVGAAIVGSVVVAMTYFTHYDIVARTTTAERTHGGLAIPPMSRASGETESFALATVTDKNDILRVLVTTSAVVFTVVFLVGTALSWMIAGRVLRPVEKVTSAARAASSGTLDHRIDLAGPPDEFKRLADTFDAMLERLDRSFQAQRRFSANASHELRTPLATTQAMLDVALLDPDSVDSATLVRKLRETNTRNIETVEALLALSDAESEAMEHEPVDLADVAREVVASTWSEAAERGIHVHTTILACSIKGDLRLVRLLLTNLVSNAIRYNVNDGDIWLTVANGTVRLENTGVLVSSADEPRLTEPFFRSVGRVAGSHGLGLALVEAIARGHRAALHLRARDGGGLVVEVAFAR